MAKKILLAEDSVTMQKVIQMTFGAEDFTVTAVSSAEEAIEQAKAIKPDVVIADLSMEGKNGYDVCSAIKAEPALQAIQILLLHGSAAPYDEARGKAAKADGEIAKPFETQAFIDTVVALTEKAVGGEKEAIGPMESLAPPIGEDIVIDTESLAVDAPPAAPKPAAPKPAAPKPAAPKPAAPKPAAPKPAAPKPAARPKPAAPKLSTPSKPSVPKPAGPPKPAAPVMVPPKPAAPKPAAPKPAAPKPAAPPMPKATTEPEPVEITIEAEPPPPTEGSGVRAFDAHSFDSPLEKPLAVESRKVEVKDSATLIGLGKPDSPPVPVPTLDPQPKPEVIVAPPPPAAPPAPEPKSELPPPPPGMPLPPSAKVPPVTPGKPYEPAAYEAIAKLSREIIEQIAWEVVPDLAEQIIREEIDRLVEKRKSS